MLACPVTVAQWTTSDLPSTQSPVTVWQDFLASQDMGDNTTNHVSPLANTLFHEEMNTTATSGQQHQLVSQPGVCSLQTAAPGHQNDHDVWISPRLKSDSSSRDSSQSFSTISAHSLSFLSTLDGQDRPDPTCVPEADNSLLALAMLSSKHPSQVSSRFSDTLPAPAIGAKTGTDSSPSYPTSVAGTAGTDGGKKGRCGRSASHSSWPEDKVEIKMTQPCVVCAESASGHYFGARVCLPCKSFFIRCTKGGEQALTAECGGMCDVQKSGRIRCQFCRFQKCLSAGMTRKEKPEAVVPEEGQVLCKVCSDIANGIHFGVDTCEGCKKFFRRGLKEYQSYRCKASGRCVINPRMRNTCRYCRYHKCLRVGMSRQAIKMGRPKKGQRIFMHHMKTTQLPEGRPLPRCKGSEGSQGKDAEVSPVEKKQVNEAPDVGDLEHKFTLEAVYDVSSLSDEFLEAVRMSTIDSKESTIKAATLVTSGSQSAQPGHPTSSLASATPGCASFGCSMASSGTSSCGSVQMYSSLSASPLPADTPVSHPASYPQSPHPEAAGPLTAHQVPVHLTSSLAPARPLSGALSQPRAVSQDVEANTKQGLDKTTVSYKAFVECYCSMRFPSQLSTPCSCSSVYTGNPISCLVDYQSNTQPPLPYTPDYQMPHPVHQGSVPDTQDLVAERPNKTSGSLSPPAARASREAMSPRQPLVKETESSRPVVSATEFSFYGHEDKRFPAPSTLSDKFHVVSEVAQKHEEEDPAKAYCDELFELFESLSEKPTISSKYQVHSGDVTPVSPVRQKENCADKLDVPAVKPLEGSDTICQNGCDAIKKESRRRQSDSVLDTVSHAKWRRFGYSHNSDEWEDYLDKRKTIHSFSQKVGYPVNRVKQTRRFFSHKYGCAGSQSLLALQGGHSVLSKSPNPSVFGDVGCNTSSRLSNEVPTAVIPLKSVCASSAGFPIQNSPHQQRKKQPSLFKHDQFSVLKTEMNSFSITQQSHQKTLLPPAFPKTDGRHVCEDTSVHLSYTGKDVETNGFTLNFNSHGMNKGGDVDSIASTLCSLAGTVTQNTENPCGVAESSSSLGQETKCEKVTSNTPSDCDTHQKLPKTVAWRDTIIHCPVPTSSESRVDSILNYCLECHAEAFSGSQCNRMVPDLTCSVALVRAKEIAEHNPDSSSLEKNDLLSLSSLGEKLLPQCCMLTNSSAAVDPQKLKDINQYFLAVDNGCEKNECANNQTDSRYSWDTCVSSACQVCLNQETGQQRSGPAFEGRGFCARRCHGYWHRHYPSPSVDHMSAHNRHLLASVASAFCMLQDHLHQLHCRNSVPRENEEQVRGTCRLLEQLHRQGLAIAAMTKQFIVQVPGGSSLQTEDVTRLSQQFSFGSALILLSSQTYDADCRRFRELFSWTVTPTCPLLCFKTRLLEVADKLHSLAMDKMETALLCALSLFSTDISGLKDVEAIADVRSSLLGGMETYISSRDQWPRIRVKRLFSVLPDVRLISAWNFAITCCRGSTSNS